MIRRLDADEWPEWRAARLDALADAPEAFGSTLVDWIDATDDRWRARIHDVPFNVIARRDDKPVGQVSATHNEPAATVELISMWVSPTVRGMGVGDALIEAVISWATSRQAHTVELSVKVSNKPARRLYERNEFSLAGAGAAADEVRMTRALP